MGPVALGYLVIFILFSAMPPGSGTGLRGAWVEYSVPLYGVLSCRKQLTAGVGAYLSY